jgi:hypothetical protein
MHFKIQGMFRLGALMLIGTFARGDVASPSLGLTLKTKRDVWVVTKANLQSGSTSETLSVSFHNLSKDLRYYTLDQISLIIRTNDGKLINISFGGADHEIAPTSKDFFALAAGQTQTYDLTVCFTQDNNKDSLAYGQPCGAWYGWLLPNGNYEIGIKYGLDKKYLESINYSEEKPYGSLVNESFVWFGLVLSNFVPVKIIGRH